MERRVGEKGESEDVLSSPPASSREAWNCALCIEPALKHAGCWKTVSPRDYRPRWQRYAPSALRALFHPEMCRCPDDGPTLVERLFVLLECQQYARSKP